MPQCLNFALSPYYLPILHQSCAQGSNEVPEAWQDEWVSGNLHIESTGAPQPPQRANSTRSAPSTRSRGSNEVPEDWQDEWVSGNRHIHSTDTPQSGKEFGHGRSSMTASCENEGATSTEHK